MELFGMVIAIALAYPWSKVFEGLTDGRIPFFDKEKNKNNTFGVIVHFGTALFFVMTWFITCRVLLTPFF